MTDFRDLQKLLGKKGEDNLEEWLEYHWNNFAADFNIGIQNLDFESNFKSEKVSASVSDGVETRIEHNLSNIPESHIVLNGIGGVIKGSTNWTNKNIYLTLDSDLYASKTKSVDILILG